MATTSLPSAPLRVLLIGAGNVGTAVAHLLVEAGHRVVGVASRSPESARRAAGFLGTAVFELGELPTADFILLGVPEDVLESLAADIGPGVEAPVVVAHFAGVVGARPLAALADRGAAAVAMHPVQACPDVATAVARLPGSAWGLSGPADVVAWAAGVVRDDLHGIPVEVSEEARPLWHAAAAVTANGLTSLLTVSYELLHAAGIDEAERILAPLASGVLANALDRGPAESLTGPIVRGDVATIETHISALAERTDLQAAYLHAARLTLSAAQLSGRVDATTTDGLADRLGIK